MLVPTSDPLRYNDARIDVALLELVRQGVAAASQLEALENERAKRSDVDPAQSADAATLAREFDARKARFENEQFEERRLRYLQFTGTRAIEKLGFHDAVSAYPELLRLAREAKLGSTPGTNQPLIAAASIAANHPELQPMLAEYLKARLGDAADKLGLAVLEAIWRADLRQFTPELEQLASMPPPAVPGPFGSAMHHATLILRTWRQPDPLTRTKLHGLLSGYLGRSNSVPTILRTEFNALPAGEQLAFRQFVSWMRSVEVPWLRTYLENTFTPHTPRPHSHIEQLLESQ